MSRSVLPCQHVQDAVDRAGLDATLVREFCTLGAMVLVPWQHWKLQHENVKIIYDSLLEISMISRLGLDWIGGTGYFSDRYDLIFVSKFFPKLSRPCAFGKI